MVSVFHGTIGRGFEQTPSIKLSVQKRLYKYSSHYIPTTSESIIVGFVLTLLPEGDMECSVS